MEKIFVSDIMTRDPVTASPNDSLLTCAKKLINKRVGSIVLVENKKLKGFLSQRDILWAAIKKPKTALTKIKAHEVSAKRIVTIKPDAKIKEALEKINRFGFERLPVVNNGNLVGMITVKDILNFKPDVYPEIEEFTKIREEAEKLKRVQLSESGSVTADGICEECGGRGPLYRVNGMLICESCNSAT